MKLGTLANQSMYLTSLSLYRVVHLWNSSPHQGIGYLIPNQVSDDAGTQKIIDAKRKLDPNFGKYEYSKSEQREKKDVQENFDDTKRTNDDLQSLEKNMAELKEKVPDEDMTSVVQELKNCIKSNRSIEKENYAIKEKLYKVYGRNFLNR